MFQEKRITIIDKIRQELFISETIVNYRSFYFAITCNIEG